MRFPASIAILALAIAFTACGDDDGETRDATTTAAEMENSESIAGRGATAENETGDTNGSASEGEAAASVEAQQKGLVGCLKRAGYAAEVIPPPTEDAPGAEFGSRGTVSVDAGSGNGAAAIFFDDAEQAKALSESAVGAQQNRSEVVGNAYLAIIGSNASKEFKAFKTCLRR